MQSFHWDPLDWEFPGTKPKSDHKYLIRSNTKLEVDDRFITKVGSDELGDIYQLDLSVDEYLKDEIFDILPKTDYTYAESASYRQDVLDEGYISPNMSRRKLRNHRLYNPEDDGDDVIHNVFMGSGSNKRRSTGSARTDRHKVLQENLTNSYIERRLEASYLERSGNVKNSYSESKKLDYSSDEEIDMSPPKLTPSKRLRVRDDGMVLRSGHHLHSVKGMLDSHSDNIDRNINASNDRRSSYMDSNNHYDTEIITTETTETTYSSSSARNSPDIRQKLNYEDDNQIDYNDRVDYEDRADYDEISHKYSSPKSHKHSNNQRTPVQSSGSINHMYGLDTDDEEDLDRSFSSNSEDDETIRESVLMIFTTIAAFFTDFFRGTIKNIRKIPSYFQASQSSPSKQSSSFTPKSSSSISSSKSHTSSSIDRYSEYSRERKRNRRSCCLWLPCCCLFLLPLLLLLALYNHDEIREITKTRFIPLIWSSEKNNTIIQQSSNLDMRHIDQRIQQLFLQLQGYDRREMLTEKDVSVIVQRLLQSELTTLRLQLDSLMKKAKDDQSVENQAYASKLSSLEALLGAAQIKNKNLEYDILEAKLNANLKTGELNDEMKLKVKELESELEAMKSQISVLKDKESSMIASVKNCCDKDSYKNTFVRQQIHDILAGMLAGGEKSKDTSDISNLFMTWLHGNYISKEEFESKMVALAEDITGKVLGLQREMKEQAVLIQSDRSSSQPVGGLSEMHVRALVDESLLRFSADRTGMADYALESAGGSLISVRCSETYYHKTALVSMFGIPLWYWSNSPRSVIQPNVNPGECWAFKGQRGQVVIELSNSIIPSGFTLEHIPKSLSPTGDIKSAPKDFTVYGLEREDSIKGISLGNYTYDDDGVSVQYFPIQIPNPPVFKFIELEVLNNYGQIKYTCLYRFRVHGTPVDVPK